MNDHKVNPRRTCYLASDGLSVDSAVVSIVIAVLRNNNAGSRDIRSVIETVAGAVQVYMRTFYISLQPKEFIETRMEDTYSSR